MKVQGFSNENQPSQVEDSHSDNKINHDDYYSEKKKEDFKKEMSRKDADGDMARKEGDAKGFKGDSSQKGLSDLSDMFSAFARQAASQTSGLQSVQQTQAASQNISISEIHDLAQALVDKILVSQPRLDGAHQVMLQLNESVLPNTDITLTRDINGMLFVNIVSSDPMAYKKLMATKDVLEAELDSHEENSFRVELSYAGAATDGINTDTDSLQQRRQNLLDENYPNV